MSIFRKEGRITLKRQISGFWAVYRRNKIGMVGLSILLFYLFLAVFSPQLTPYDPIMDKRLAEGFAMPEWMSIFPGYSNAPRTQVHSLYWDIMTEPESTTIEWGKDVKVMYSADQAPQAEVYLTSNFDYSYDPPTSFYCSFKWSAPIIQNASYSLELSLETTNGTKYRLWTRPPSEDAGGQPVQVESSDYHLIKALGFVPGKDNLASLMLSRNGTYTLIFRLSIRSTGPNARATIFVENSEFIILGVLHGILGADHLGGDLFSQLIYGARISLEIGVLAAVVSTGLGIIVGVMAGYMGGATDEILMRIVDILICLPVLPLLLVLIYLFGASVWYIVLLIAVFGWLGLSRLIRSQILYLREMAYVECAKAAGASRFYIMFRHLVPNVLPLAFASMVLSVPGAIITEAVLSFLGFGDPAAPTWGRMLNHAFGFGAFGRLAWWWILPPGLAITILCLAFVFMGHAVDEIVNPRLRRRE